MKQSRKVAPVLALDIGNVLLNVDPQPLLQTLGFADMDAFRAFDQDGKAWDAMLAFEEGRTSETEFRRWFADAFRVKMTATEVDEIWNSLLAQETNGMREIVKDAIRHGVKPVFLSDICPIRYKATLSRLSFARLVGDAVLSFEVGKHKPHPAMYETMEREHCGGGIPLLYVDDLQANVDAARERGWRSYLFGDVNELELIMNDCMRNLS